MKEFVTRESFDIPFLPEEDLKRESRLVADKGPGHDHKQSLRSFYLHVAI